MLELAVYMCEVQKSVYVVLFPSQDLLPSVVGEGITIIKCTLQGTTHSCLASESCCVLPDAWSTEARWILATVLGLSSASMFLNEPSAWDR